MYKTIIGVLFGVLEYAFPKIGLPHPTTCPYCDQSNETINHLLVSCVYAYEFWFKLLHKSWLTVFGSTIRRGLLRWLVGKKISSSLNGPIQEGTNSLIILGVLTLWCHRYRYVFDGASLSIARAQLFASDELHLCGWLWLLEVWSWSCSFCRKALLTWVFVVYVFCKVWGVSRLVCKKFILNAMPQGQSFPCRLIFFLICDSYVCSGKKNYVLQL